MLPISGSRHSPGTPQPSNQPSNTPPITQGTGPSPRQGRAPNLTTYILRREIGGPTPSFRSQAEQNCLTLRCMGRSALRTLIKEITEEEDFEWGTNDIANSILSFEQELSQIGLHQAPETIDFYAFVKKALDLANDTDCSDFISFVLDLFVHLQVMVPNDEKDDLLFWGASESHVNLLGLLITQGVNVNAQDTNGDTSLHVLLHNDTPNLKAIDLLLKNGANPNLQDAKGNTPLHLVLEEYTLDFKALDLLLKMGAKVNVTNKDGETPLHFLLEQENPSIEALDLLLKNGADPTIQDAYGKTCLDMVKDLGNPEISKLFEKN